MKNIREELIICLINDIYTNAQGDDWNEIYEELKGPKYICSTCEKPGYTIDDCEHCLRDCLRKDFSNWTSNSSNIDEAIQDAQIQMPLPRALTEWIPYIHLENIEFLKQGGCSSIYTATWTNGLITSFGSATNNERFLNEVISSGITRDPLTKDFVLVLKKLDGDLRDYIFKNHKSLTWKEIYRLLS
ncbi:12273_t:CDS:2, partial [Dentiscutata heterogama]